MIMPSDDFMEAVNKHDCPDKIFALAKTDFEKAVAIEFFFIHKRLNKSDNDMRWLKYLVKGVFGVGVLGILTQVIPILLGMG